MSPVPMPSHGAAGESGGELARVTDRLDAVSMRLDALASETLDLRQAMFQLGDELLRATGEMQAALKTALAASSKSQPEGTQRTAARPETMGSAATAPTRLRPGEYKQLVERVGRLVRDKLPREPALLVVSRGDPELLRQAGPRAAHFPQRDDGVYAGFYPADSVAAISHLEALRAHGAEFICFPSTALWWLDYYPALREHLEQRYRVVVNEPSTCIIFSLGSERRASPALATAAANADAVRLERYRLLIGQIREVVESLLPPTAIVLVVSRGDPELLRLGGRRARHFPQTADGTYAGHSPTDGAEAIAHLESLRTRGAEYLLFPSTAFWWLDYYAELREHLEQQYRLVTRQRSVCVIFALADGPSRVERSPESRDSA